MASNTSGNINCSVFTQSRCVTRKHWFRLNCRQQTVMGLRETASTSWHIHCTHCAGFYCFGWLRIDRLSVKQMKILCCRVKSFISLCKGEINKVCVRRQIYHEWHLTSGISHFAFHRSKYVLFSISWRNHKNGETQLHNVRREIAVAIVA